MTSKENLTQNSFCRCEEKDTENYSYQRVQNISEEKVENQIVRCTEITCMYSSSEETHNKQTHTTIKPKSFSQSPSDWKNVVNATLDVDKDILLEVDTNDSQCCSLKDVQAVELVIAVQSAIKQRQELIEEWKSKTSCLTEQIERLQCEKYTLEKANLCKDSELELLAKKLHELHKQYKILHHDSNKLKKELENLRVEYNTLSETYNLTVCEFKQTKKQLNDAIDVEKNLEGRLKQQMKKTEQTELNSCRLEEELNDSRKHIKKLTISLEETSKELLCIKKTLEEYKCTEKKLESLRTKYSQLKEKYNKIDICLSQALEENSSLKETISKLNLMIESLTSDKNELIVAVQCLNNEKNHLLEQNNKLSRELTSFKHNFQKVQNALRCFESEVDILKRKVEDLESCNKNLFNELNNARLENKNLSDNLYQTASECTTLSRALAEAQQQLEAQQKLLMKCEAKVRSLLNEKQRLEMAVDGLTDENKTNESEMIKLVNENNHLKNQNNELVCRLNKVAGELNESMNEIKHLEKEIELLKASIESEREKHELHVAKLQEKMRLKSAEWKDYVTKEVNRLRNKRRAEIKKYLEMNKDLENRLVESQEESRRTEIELNETVMKLSRQLEQGRSKLDETIHKAESESKELRYHYTTEISQLKELLAKQKLESQWVITELESKIQNLVGKNLDDESVIFQLTKENNHLKEKVSKLHIDLEELKNSRCEINALMESKFALECELENCRGLLSLAEKTAENLRIENEECQSRIKEEQELVKTLRVKLVKLKKIIGKKDAHIEVLNNTISQLKERLGAVIDENAELKTVITDMENKQNQMAEKIKSLNQELHDAKRALIEAGDDQKELLLTIKQIEAMIKKVEQENTCLKTELQQAKENEYLADKALQSSHKIQHELKERVIAAESDALKYENEAKQLESKLYKMQEKVRNLETEISSLTEAYQYNDAQHKKKIESLECQLTNTQLEMDQLRSQLDKSEKRVNRYKILLKESQKALVGLVSIFDSLRETLCQVLCLEYVPINLKSIGDLSKDLDCSRHVDYCDFLNSYKIEVEKYTVNLFDLKNNENELNGKLINTKKDFEKLSKIMKDLQFEYMQKVEKLYQSLKNKEDLIRSQEKQLVEIQLEAAGADEALATSLKNKIEDQYNTIKKLQEEKSILQNEILCLAKQVNSLESQIFELVEKLKLIEVKNSKLQMKNVSLEGDLEKLTLVLKESRDAEQDQISQYKEMMLANRELMEKIRVLKCQLEQGNLELEELRYKKSYDSQCCFPPKSHRCEEELEREIRRLTEKFKGSQRAEREAKQALHELEKKLAMITEEMTECQAEKATLEGWVSHLQQLVSGGYIADCSLPKQLQKVENEKKALEKTIESLKCNISTLVEEKKHFKHTIENLSRCNGNLEETIQTISKNKGLLEKELQAIQKKVDGLCHKTKSVDSDLSTCSRDISYMIDNACSITKSLKCSEQNCLFQKDIEARYGKSYNGPCQFESEESLDSIAITVGCKNINSDTTGSTECVVKHFDWTDSSKSRTFEQSCLTDIQDESCQKMRQSEILVKQTVTKKTKEKNSSPKSKTFV